MTARPSVPATKMESTIACIEVGKPGAYFIDDSHPNFVICECPCGCTAHMRLPIHREGTTPTAKTSWQWNGNLDEPTLTPSIRDNIHCRFHGHLVNGVWIFEGDSGVRRD